MNWWMFIIAWFSCTTLFHILLKICTWIDGNPLTERDKESLTICSFWVAPIMLCFVIIYFLKLVVYDNCKKLVKRNKAESLIEKKPTKKENYYPLEIEK